MCFPPEACIGVRPSALRMASAADAFLYLIVVYRKSGKRSRLAAAVRVITTYNRLYHAARVFIASKLIYPALPLQYPPPVCSRSHVLTRGPLKPTRRVSSSRKKSGKRSRLGVGCAGDDKTRDTCFFVTHRFFQTDIYPELAQPTCPSR